MEKRNQSSRDSSGMGGQKSTQSGSSKQTGQQMKSGQNMPQGSHTSGSRESTAKGGSSHSGNR